jgi:hypothetical protein
MWVVRIRRIPIKKRVLISLLFQLIVGAVFFVPELRLEARERRPFSETVAFYIIEWVVTAAWFLGDASVTRD